MFQNLTKYIFVSKPLYFEVMNCRQFSRGSFFIEIKGQVIRKSVQNFSTLPAEAILSTENRMRCISRLQEMKPTRMQPGANPSKKAAVLVPLCKINQELSLLYTLRSSDLKSYRGQVSFPGGMFDKTDASLQETAIRETNEELGISKSQIDIWGHGSVVGTVSKDMSVTPYIGYIGEVELAQLKLNPKEVESVFSMPLTALSDPTNFKYTQYRSGYMLPVFLGGEHRVWGMTAIITHIVLGALLPGIYKNKLLYIKPVRGIIKEKS